MKASRITTIAAAMMAAAATLPAQAADAIKPQPSAPLAPAYVSTPALDWDGGYAGVALGYGFAGRNEVTQQHIEAKTKGFIGSGFAGWNFQTGGFVYGVEGDIGYSAVKGSNAGMDFKSGAEGSLRARLGYAITENILLYGTAGGAAERLKVTQGGRSDTNTMLGWTAGVGVDARVTDNVFARVEYRLTSFGSKNFDLGSGSASVKDGNNRVMIGLGMTF
ncbi:outer membrane protein [Nitratireductor luteus]|uniref:outer membrane protein n=1 Tax=Nitratireductor luteus TaxID=2976980 RepID=UPI002240768A|nr:outer membrane protein [Nitratireductor luteus]